MILVERIIKYADDVDTDVIIPARYLNISDPEELASHCMEDLDKDFPEKARERHIIVAGSNFGTGSSREHAPIVLKQSGIELIIAKSFARIFYRNCINTGLRPVVCPEIYDKINDGDTVSVDFYKGTIILGNMQFSFPPYPDFLNSIIENGGLAEAISEGFFNRKD